MKKIGIIVILIAAVVVYFKLAYPDYTYRYRMTVEVDTPDGLKSGSSVIEIHTTQWPDWLAGLANGNTSAVDITGEAIFVDLGNNKNVVCLLSTGILGEGVNSMMYLLPRAFFELQGSKPEWAKKLSSMTGQKIEIIKNQVPSIITFSDIKNPKTAKMVYAIGAHEVTDGKNKSQYQNIVEIDNFEEIFGKGFRLNSVLVELTNDPVSHDLIEKLKWRKNQGRPAYDAWMAILEGKSTGAGSIEPETLFVRTK